MKEKDKMTNQRSSLPNLLMPEALILVLLIYLIYKYRDFIQNLSGTELWMLNFAVFIVGIFAGILTERFFAWGGKPFLKKEGEDYSSRLRKKIIKWGLIYAIGLPLGLLIAWLLVAGILPPSELLFWKKRYLFYFSYFLGAIWGIFIPPLLELCRASRVDREN